MPETGYVEIRAGGYYLAGTRIGLDVLIQDFRDGRSAEAIFDAYPSIGSLAKVYGAIAFILEHPAEIESYLREQHLRYERFRAANPLPTGMVERFEHSHRETPAGKS